MENDNSITIAIIDVRANEDFVIHYMSFTKCKDSLEENTEFPESE